MSDEHTHHHHEDHHRESFEVSGGEAFLEAHMHDQAATVSMAICPNESESIAFSILVKALKTIASRIENAGGIVGHCKAFAQQDDLFAHVSVTDADIPPVCKGDVSASFGDEADLQLVAIALLVSQDELIAICKQTLGSL